MANDVKIGGCGFFSLLTLLFIFLKLTGYINWSWWWVLAPTWMPVVLVLAILIIAAIFCLIAYLIFHK